MFDITFKFFTMKNKIIYFSEQNKVRLINGSAPFQGRVQFYHNFEWGSIFDANENFAHTVCRMLEYNAR